MPNWCYTRITIQNEDIGELEKFNLLLEEWTSKNYIENGFGKNWLGNIIGNFGLDEWDENNREFKSNIPCRGRITYFERSSNELLIDTETAWSPMLEMWYKLVDSFIPGSTLIYSAEECGCGIFETNDTSLKDKYYLDIWETDEVSKLYGQEVCSDYEASEEYIIDILQHVLNSKERVIEELLNSFQQSDMTDYMQIHKWDFAA